jgi:hypothetical protein
MPCDAVVAGKVALQKESERRANGVPKENATDSKIK